MATWPDPRSISVGFAFGHSQYEDPTGLTFETVSPADDPDTGDDPGPVLDGFTITDGRIGDAPETQATEIDLTMRNDDGEFSPDNVSGTRYGTLRMGTPLQLGIGLGSGPEPLATANALDFLPSSTGPDIDPQVRVPALGLLNRFGRDQVVASPLRRTIGAAGPAAYWPMEDAPGLDQLASALPGGATMIPGAGTAESVASVGADEIAAGSLAVPRWTSAGAFGSLATIGGWTALLPAVTGTTWAATVSIRATNPNGTNVSWAAAIMPLPTAGSGLYSYIEVFDTVSGGRGVKFEYISSNIQSTAVDVFDGEAHEITVTMAAGALSLYIDGTLEASTGVVQSVHFPSNVWVAAQPFAASHLDTVNNTDSTLSVGHFAYFAKAAGPFYSALLGYVGEDAHDRIERICTEASIPYSSGTSDSAALGPQPIGTALAIMRDSETTDGGVLYELGDGRLTFQSSRDRYNAAVALSLSWNDIVGAWPGNRDRDLYNQVTVTGTDGTTATAELTDGPLGTDTADGVGPRPLPVTRNVADTSLLPDYAGWLLHLKTTGKSPYQVIIDLTSEPSLASDVLGCGIGSRIQITDIPAADLGPDDLDLIIEGREISYRGSDLLVVWHCEPYDPWDVGTYQSSTVTAADKPTRYDTPDAVAATSFTTGTDTTLRVITGGTGPLWTTTGPFNFDVECRGCVLSVSAIGSAGAGIADTFTRTSSSSWGTTDTGQAWTNYGGTAVDFSVSSGAGKHALPTTDDSRQSLLGIDVYDFDVSVTLSIPVVATGADIHAALMARWTDTTHYYMLEVQSDYDPSGQLVLGLYKRVGATATGLAFLASPTNGSDPNEQIPIPGITGHTAGASYRIRFCGIGGVLLGKIWPAAGTEPNMWFMRVEDTTFTHGDVGLRSNRVGGNTNGTQTISYDNLVLNRSQAFTVAAASPSGVTIPAGEPVHVRDRGYYAL